MFLLQMCLLDKFFITIDTLKSVIGYCIKSYLNKRSPSFIQYLKRILFVCGQHTFFLFKLQFKHIDILHLTGKQVKPVNNKPFRTIF